MLSDQILRDSLPPGSRFGCFRLALVRLSSADLFVSEEGPEATPSQFALTIPDRVLQYVEANLEADISVSDLAEAACFSLFHFARAFHLAMGRPPHAYLSERRLDRARHLLAHSDNSLVDISLTCRFSGQANFTKAFKRAVGVSPGRYRRAHQ